MGFEEELIEEVKKEQIIFNKKYCGYKNIAKKVEIWDNIAKKLDVPGK